MSLHGLLSVTMGVPNVDETAAYYTDFGLAPEEAGWFSTRDAGRQLRIVQPPTHAPRGCIRRQSETVLHKPGEKGDVFQYRRFARSVGAKQGDDLRNAFPRS